MILEAFRLNGKAALVTGAAQGLGAALAVGLAEAGADVALLDIRPCDVTRDHIHALGRRAHVLQTDLAQLTQERAEAIIAEAATALSGFDILINNAGIICRAPALDTAQEDWQAVLDLNLSAVFTLSQAAARCFTTNNSPGKIINIASMLSFQGGVFVPAYAAAKSGIAGLTRALANEWASREINVNAIAPGYMATEVTAQLRADAARSEAILNRIPAGRWGEPDDLKGAVVFLASDASRYVHGTILAVDGGWLAR